MVNVCDRWNKDKTDNLQAAFFNGVGYETWENIWGIWNGITERDAEAIRRVAKIERRFAEFLTSPGWEPHTPTVQYGVFASKWPRGERTLWTIVNRTAYDIDGTQLAGRGAAAACTTSTSGMAWSSKGRSRSPSKRTDSAPCWRSPRPRTPLFPHSSRRCTR